MNSSRDGKEQTALKWDEAASAEIVRWLYGDSLTELQNIHTRVQVASIIFRHSAALRSRLQEVEKERDALKLSTCSTLWWEDGDRSFDSPEYYAEERGLKVGDEFELQGARYRDEKFRVVKIADDTSDDYECEEITNPKAEDFEAYFSIEKRAERAERQNQELREALEKLNAEVIGITTAYSVDLCEAIGMTNLSVLIQRRDRAGEALEKK